MSATPPNISMGAVDRSHKSLEATGSSVGARFCALPETVGLWKMQYAETAERIGIRDAPLSGLAEPHGCGQTTSLNAAGDLARAQATGHEGQLLQNPNLSSPLLSNP
jgi:hypothetical protein